MTNPLTTRYSIDMATTYTATFPGCKAPNTSNSPTSAICWLSAVGRLKDGTVDGIPAREFAEKHGVRMLDWCVGIKFTKEAQALGYVEQVVHRFTSHDEAEAYMTLAHTPTHTFRRGAQARDRYGDDLIEFASIWHDLEQ